MRVFGIFVLISCLLLVALGLGCISSEKAMNVSVETLEKTIESEPVEGGIKVKVTVLVRAKNVGDSGNVDIFVQVFDDIDAKFMESKERIHMDEGDSRDLTLTVEKVAPEDADVDSFHVSTFSDNPTPD
jgi:hypothetical protein